MKTKTTMDKNKVKEAIKKMYEDKEAVRSYIKGKTDLETIKKRGIKFAKPL